MIARLSAARNDPATRLQARIASIDVVDSVATVRLELDNWIGYRYTDMFTLLKVDGEWKMSAFLADSFDRSGRIWYSTESGVVRHQLHQFLLGRFCIRRHHVSSA